MNDQACQSASVSGDQTAAKLTRCLVVLLLLIHAALLMWSGYAHSPGTDEPGHLVAGIAIWELGRYDLYPVNPPLIKSIAAAPVVFSNAKTQWRNWSRRPGARSAWQVGRDFMALNADQLRWYFALARWALIPVSLLGGFICFCWARDLYSPQAGILALGLWCFSPSVLGNGAMITPDVGAAAFGILAGYRFWKWLREPNGEAALLCGLALGLALLTKSTWIILFPLWPILWLSIRLVRRTSWPALKRELRGLLAILVLGLYLLNSGYFFTGSFQRLGDYQFFTSTLAGDENYSIDRSTSGNRFAGTLLGHVPVPLPHDYVKGLDLQKHDFEAGKWCYMDGKHQFGGWWYFYLYALMVKVPVGVGLLCLVAIGLRLSGRIPVRVTDEVVLCAPALVIFLLVSSQTGFTIYLRYLLPAYPALFIWISPAAMALRRETYPPVRWLTAAAIFWFANSSLAYYPHSLSYFNELAGGPRSGPKHLLDGNIDWGQDFWELRDWYAKNRFARPFFFAYYGQTNPRRFGIRAGIPPTAPRELSSEELDLLRERLRLVASTDRSNVEQTKTVDDADERVWMRPGWYALSVNALYGYRTRIWFDNRPLAASSFWFRYFHALDPIDRVGYSIYIYRIDEAQADVISRTYGIEPTLPPTEDEVGTESADLADDAL